MKKMMIIAMTLTSVGSISLMFVEGAAATKPGLLPTPTAASPVSLVSVSSAFSFSSGFTIIRCSSTTDAESFTSESGGTFSLVCIGAKDILSRTCTGLSDTTSGQITLSGTFRIRYSLNSKKELVTVLIFLLPLAGIHTSCGATLGALTGCIAALWSPVDLHAPKHSLTAKKHESDDEMIVVLKEESTETENCELKSSLNEGTAELSAMEFTEELSGFKQSGKAVEAEMMA
jgi:hypothetical protein